MSILFPSIPSRVKNEPILPLTPCADRVPYPRILDPITTLAQLALLSYKNSPGWKLEVTLDEGLAKSHAGLFQGLLRSFYGSSSIDWLIVSRALNNLACKEAHDLRTLENIEVIFDRAAMSIQQAHEAYEQQHNKNVQSANNALSRARSEVESARFSQWLLNQAKGKDEGPPSPIGVEECESPESSPKASNKVPLWSSVWQQSEFPVLVEYFKTLNALCLSLDNSFDLDEQVEIADKCNRVYEQLEKELIEKARSFFEARIVRRQDF